MRTINKVFLIGLMLLSIGFPTVAPGAGERIR